MINVRLRRAVVLVGALLTALSPAAGERYVAPTGIDVYLCFDPEDPCASLGYAMSVATAGDTIHMEEGTYLENVEISKDLRILGSGSSKTVIDGGRQGPVVHVGTRRRPP